MPKHKRFIESQKNAVTYRVINREMGASQYDDNAPKTIWVPKSENTEPIFPLPNLPVSKPNPNDERLFPSKGPRPDWDPDVTAALDDDFDFDDPSNILEDDFIAKADALSLVGTENSAGDKAAKEGGGSEFSDDDSNFNFSDCESLNSQNLFERKTTSKKDAVSQYSMTSAVTNCTESVKTFNEHFEKIMEAYGEDEIGALDFDNIEGCLTDENPILDDLYKEKEAEELMLGEYDNRFKKFVLNFAETEPKEKIVEIVTEGKIEFDCESILSTNSNLFNHPAVIKANYKKNSTKTCRKSSVNKSLDVDLELDKISEDEDSDDDEVPERCSAICSTRPKNETAEERRERKKLLKTAKREQRALKKENKVAFRNAKKKMSKEEINLQHNAGVKLL